MEAVQDSIQLGYVEEQEVDIPVPAVIPDLIFSDILHNSAYVEYYEDAQIAMQAPDDTIENETLPNENLLSEGTEDIKDDSYVEEYWDVAPDSSASSLSAEPDSEDDEDSEEEDLPMFGDPAADFEWEQFLSNDAWAQSIPVLEAMEGFQIPILGPMEPYVHIFSQHVADLEHLMDLVSAEGSMVVANYPLHSDYVEYPEEFDSQVNIKTEECEEGHWAPHAIMHHNGDLYDCPLMEQQHELFGGQSEYELQPEQHNVDDEIGENVRFPDLRSVEGERDARLVASSEWDEQTSILPLAVSPRSLQRPAQIDSSFDQRQDRKESLSICSRVYKHHNAEQNDPRPYNEARSSYDCNFPLLPQQSLHPTQHVQRIGQSPPQSFIAPDAIMYTHDDLCDERAILREQAGDEDQADPQERQNNAMVANQQQHPSDWAAAVRAPLYPESLNHYEQIFDEWVSVEKEEHHQAEHARVDETVPVAAEPHYSANYQDYGTRTVMEDPYLTAEMCEELFGPNNSRPTGKRSREQEDSSAPAQGTAFGHSGADTVDPNNAPAKSTGSLVDAVKIKRPQRYPPSSFATQTHGFVDHQAAAPQGTPSPRPPLLFSSLASKLTHK